MFHSILPLTGCSVYALGRPYRSRMRGSSTDEHVSEKREHGRRRVRTNRRETPHPTFASCQRTPSGCVYSRIYSGGAQGMETEMEPKKKGLRSLEYVASSSTPWSARAHASHAAATCTKDRARMRCVHSSMDGQRWLTSLWSPASNCRGALWVG